MVTEALPAYRVPLGWSERLGYHSLFRSHDGRHELAFYQRVGSMLAIPYCEVCGERRGHR